AAALPASVVAHPTNIVRIRGAMNATNQLTGATVIADATTTITMCGAPSLFTSNSFGLFADVNSFDADGPISGTPFIFNPQGTAAVEFRCDQSAEVIRMDGAANIPFAPNFTMRRDISKDVNACFEFQIDQFGWITNGSKKTTPANPQYGTVSGVLTGVTLGQITNPPTQPTQVRLPGATAIAISGVTFTIAGNNLLTLLDPFVPADVLSGTQQVCLRQVIDPSGQNGGPLAPGPGTFTPPRAGQLINGTTLKKGVCVP
ncbi:MAG: hypothetical protein ACKVZH_28660, partial [Blastocatellia bacterium]